jgi:hypothetical protein
MPSTSKSLIPKGMSYRYYIVIWAKGLKRCPDVLAETLMQLIQ